jgi:threonine/homoserine/homoserine lactone efflux protein
MPGPMLAVVVAQSPRQGMRAGPLTVLGHAILELALLLALVVGLGDVLARSDVKTGLALVGGAMLLATAAGMATYVLHGRASTDWSAERAASGKLRTVLSGVVSSLANPYWTIWWATIGMGLLVKAYAAGLVGIIAFYFGHITGDLTWYSAVSGAVAAGRRLMTARVYAGMLLAATTFLVGMATWFIVSGIGGIG